MNLPIHYETTHWAVRKKAREQYVKEQKNLCYHCKQPLNIDPKRTKVIHEDLYPAHFFKWPIHLHHDHRTGMTIGAVHAYCNAVLWEYHGE